MPGQRGLQTGFRHHKHVFEKQVKVSDTSQHRAQPWGADLLGDMGPPRAVPTPLCQAPASLSRQGRSRVLLLVTACLPEELGGGPRSGQVRQGSEGTSCLLTRGNVPGAAPCS